MANIEFSFAIERLSLAAFQDRCEHNKNKNGNINNGRSFALAHINGDNVSLFKIKKKDIIGSVIENMMIPYGGSIDFVAIVDEAAVLADLSAFTVEKYLAYISAIHKYDMNTKLCFAEHRLAWFWMLKRTVGSEIKHIHNKCCLSGESIHDKKRWHSEDVSYQSEIADNSSENDVDSDDETLSTGSDVSYSSDDEDAADGSANEVANPSFDDGVAADFDFRVFRSATRHADRKLVNKNYGNSIQNAHEIQIMRQIYQYWMTGNNWNYMWALRTLVAASMQYSTLIFDIDEELSYSDFVLHWRSRLFKERAYSMDDQCVDPPVDDAHEQTFSYEMLLLTARLSALCGLYEFPTTKQFLGRPLKISIFKQSQVQGIYPMDEFVNNLSQFCGGLPKFDWQTPTYKMGLCGSIIPACAIINIYTKIQPKKQNKTQFQQYIDHFYNAFVREYWYSVDGLPVNIKKHIAEMLTPTNIDIVVECDIRDFSESAKRIFDDILKSHPEAVLDDIDSLGKYRVHAIPRNFDIHHVDNLAHAVSRFHLGCVRAWYDGSKLNCFPSFITAAYTGINIDLRWESSGRDLYTTILKYAQRGFTTILTDDQRDRCQKMAKDMVAHYSEGDSADINHPLAGGIGLFSGRNYDELGNSSCEPIEHTIDIRHESAMRFDIGFLTKNYKYELFINGQDGFTFGHLGRAG